MQICYFIILFRGVQKEQLSAVVSFLYKGETSVQKVHLDSFLALARELGVRGFSEVVESQSENSLIKEKDAEHSSIEDGIGEETLAKEIFYQGGPYEMSNNKNGYTEADSKVIDDRDRVEIKAELSQSSSKNRSYLEVCRES